LSSRHLLVFLGLLFHFLWLAENVSAEETFPVQVAHNNGFYGCDSLVNAIVQPTEEMGSYITASNFPELKGASLSMIVYHQYGRTTHIVFTKDKQTCFAYESNVAAFTYSCEQVRSDALNSVLFKEKLGSFFFGDNGKNVNFATQQLTDGGCLVHTNVSKNSQVDR